MKYLNSDGLRTVLSKIKNKFATKQELQDVEKKVGGGYEEVNIKVTLNAYTRYFKLVKIGRRVDVFQVHSAYPVSTSLPPKYQASETVFIGLTLGSDGGNKFLSDGLIEGLFVDTNLRMSARALSSNDIKARAVLGGSPAISQLYIGSYITKE